ncbi:MAG: hypothetical protein IV090_09620 [Candidatus Sericytochromatia bacterium]|nr:hypothetical protein [Candidatus Sericytochromatia bacterium]
MIQHKILKMGLGILLGMGLFVSPVQAAWMTHPEANVKIDIPDSWKKDVNGNMLTVGPSDDSLAVMFWVVEGSDLEAIMSGFDSELKNIMQDIQYASQEPQEVEVNGFKAYYMQGTGTVDGAAADFEVSILIAAKPLVVFSMAKDGALSTHSSDISALVNSIQAAE